MWIFCHPAFVHQTIAAINKVLKIDTSVEDISVARASQDASPTTEASQEEAVEASSDEPKEPPAKKLKVETDDEPKVKEEAKKKDVNKSKLEPRNVPAVRAPKFTSPQVNTCNL